MTTRRAAPDARPDVLLGVDTGGTFTDFVCLDGGRLRIHKALSTPAAPEQAVLAGIDELLGREAAMQVVHGSTVATNALLEGKGVPTAYLTSPGMADVLTLGRQARPELYRLWVAPQPPPVPPRWCLEAPARIAADGRVLRAPAPEDLRRLAAALDALPVEAVAINLLFSFRRPELEQRLARALPRRLFVSCSSDVLAECGEYERGIATWINASLGPRMAAYLERLAGALPRGRVAVMQSHGGSIEAAVAGRGAVHLLLSGPAGGLVGARSMAARAGCTRLLTFDMGGTSTDVALIDGDLRLTREGRVGRYPVAVPMVDMHTIGAGGGSIARVDRGGRLLVGPESAGADPGPACYGRGGRAATVTDANVVLGRLPAFLRLGGRLPLDADAARAALARLGRALGLDAVGAARGVVQLANEHMVQALRVISVQRGIDVRDHVLLCFGGAGGLHVCALAEALGMRRALVPAHGGVLSALGMLAAPRRRLRSQAVARLLDEVREDEIAALAARLAVEPERALRAEGVRPADLRRRVEVELRYRGQAYTLTLPWQAPAALAAAFHETHRARYGHALDLPVELVSLRLSIEGPPPVLDWPAYRPAPGPVRLGEAAVNGVGQPVPCLARAALAAGDRIEGPALILEDIATTWLAPGWLAEVDACGNLLLTRRGSADHGHGRAQPPPL
ncbi:MAG: N-methylhydantoinase A [Gammaproteobacteria bacterium]|nr:MAG: N-methylhydantoinase A [Gammaproteobacteria bacterium]